MEFVQLDAFKNLVHSGWGLPMPTLPLKCNLTWKSLFLSLSNEGSIPRLNTQLRSLLTFVFIAV